MDAPTQTVTDAAPAPVTAHLVDHLMSGLGHGAWAVGDRLPSVRALARDRRVSIATVLAAYARLEDRGLIVRRPRSGLFVARRPEPIPMLAVSRPSPRISAPVTVDLEALAAEVLDPARQQGVAPFGAAVPPADLLPLPALAGHLRRRLAHGAVWSAYADPAGVPALRAAIARRLLAAGVAVPPDELVVTTGCMEAVTLALRAVCRPGDVVAIESPMFFGILQVIGSLGLRVVEIPSHARDGMQLDALREALDEHPVRAVLAITSFSNPLGACMPEAARRDLVGLLAERDIPLIEDDIYGELAHHGPRPLLARASDQAGNVLVCGSFSKCLSAGLRIGWVAGGRHAPAVRHLKMTSTVACPTLPQLAVADYLDQGSFDRHLRRMRAALGARCAGLAEAVLAAFPPGTRTTRPTGGFCLWVELPTAIDAVALYRLAAADGIAIAPGHLFSAKKRYQHFIRLNASAFTPALAPRIAHLGRLAAHLLRR
jgi:DNA-binding transcriptional MocR family regulator